MALRRARRKMTDADILNEMSFTEWRRGLEIVERVVKASKENGFSLGIGGASSIYPNMKRLHREGAVEDRWIKEGDEKVREWKLTNKGLRKKIEAPEEPAVEGLLVPSEA